MIHISSLSYSIGRSKGVEKKASVEEDLMFGLNNAIESCCK